MTRQLWALLTWSTSLGAPAVVVGVLGVQQDDEHPVVSAVEWIPLEDERNSTWRRRLATTPPADLPHRLPTWQQSPTEPAVPIPIDPAGPPVDLATAVAVEVDAVLAAAREV